MARADLFGLLARFELTALRAEIRLAPSKFLEDVFEDAA